jgi:hypothetical protein
MNKFAFSSANLTSNWTLMRILRLVTGAMVLGQGITTGQWLFAGIGGYLFLMSMLNIGGCSSGVCGVQPFRKPAREPEHEVHVNEMN